MMRLFMPQAAGTHTHSNDLGKTLPGWHGRPAEAAMTFAGWNESQSGDQITDDLISATMRYTSFLILSTKKILELQVSGHEAWHNSMSFFHRSDSVWQYGLPALEMSAEKETRQVGRVEKICQKHLRCYQICIPVSDPKYVHGHMEFDFKHESCIDPSKWFKWIWYDLIRPVQKFKRVISLLNPAAAVALPKRALD